MAGESPANIKTQKKTIMKTTNLLKQKNLSSTQYQLVKKLKNFNSQNYIWKADVQLYERVKLSKMIPLLTKCLIHELINQGHSEDTIVHYLEMESMTIDEAYSLIKKCTS